MKKERILYLDVLKFIAIFSVVSLHLLGIVGDVEMLNLKIRAFRNIFILAVPIFLMITGVFFLNKNIELGMFFKKRFTRIIYPSIFFTVIVLLIFNPHRTFFSCYWYCWMIVGVIFAIPIVNKFIINCSEKDLKYYILVIICFSVIQQLFIIFNIQYSLDMTFFLNPIAYLIIGYYLYNHDFNCSPNRILIISATLFIVTSIIRFNTGKFYYSEEIHTFLDLTLVQIIQASSVFVFVKYLFDERVSGVGLRIQNFLNFNHVKKFIISVSKASYGMYFFQHPLIFEVIKPKYSNLHLTGIQTFVSISALIVMVFLASWIFTIVLSRIPYLKIVSGYN